MHVQTSLPTSEFEMYINDNNSDETRENYSYQLHSNSSYELLDGELYSNVDSVSSDIHQTTRGISLVIYVVIGCIFNTFMIVSIVPNRRLRTVRNILLVHLGCTGLMMSLIINMITAVVSFTGQWFGGVVTCQIYGYLLSVLTLGTSWTICALSWNKYQTIASPLHHSFTAKAVKVAAYFCVFWTIACILSLPPVLVDNRYLFHPQMGICFVFPKSLKMKIYMFIYLLASIYIPLGIMLFCYTHIYRIARTQSSRIAATMVQMTRVIQATIAPNTQPSSLSIRGTKAMCTIVQLIGAFVVVYVPISVILLMEILSSKACEINYILLSIIQMLFLSAPVIHSSVYGVRNKILRTSFQRFIRQKIRYYCYKDRRKNSVKSFKSFRSSSFKANLMQRRLQNGETPGLRRTQSFPTRGFRNAQRYHGRSFLNNGNQCIVAVANGSLTKQAYGNFPRPHSYNVLNPESALKYSETQDIQEMLEPIPDGISSIDEYDF